jgi:hypothetical protein
MSLKIAHIISFLLHPFFIPAYTFLFLLYQPFWFNWLIPEQIKLRLIAIVFSFTAIFPLISILFFKRLNIIKDWQLNEQKERIYPFIMILFSYAVLFYLLIEYPAFSIYPWITVSAAITIFLVFIINFFTKISAHLSAIGGLLGMLLAVSWYLEVNLLIHISIIVLAGGCLAWARLRLHAHTTFQVFLGYILGISIMFLGLSIFYFNK